MLFLRSVMVVVAAGFLVSCGGTTTEPPTCEPDALEPNDAAGSATDVPEDGETYPMLALEDADEDWFRVTLCTSAGAAPIAAEITAEATFSHANGDLDIEILNDDATAVLGISLSTDDDESVSVIDDYVLGAAEGEVLVRVFHKDGSGCTPYELTIDTNCGCPDDVFEPNDTEPTATDIGGTSRPGTVPPPPAVSPDPARPGPTTTNAVLQTITAAVQDDNYKLRVCPFEEIEVTGTFPRLPDNRLPPLNTTDVAASFDANFTYPSNVAPPVNIPHLMPQAGGMTIFDGLVPQNQSLVAGDAFLRFRPGAGICTIYDLDVEYRFIGDDEFDVALLGDDRANPVQGPPVLPPCPVTASVNSVGAAPIDRTYSVDMDEDWYAIDPTPGSRLEIYLDEIRDDPASTTDGDVDFFLYKGTDIAPIDSSTIAVAEDSTPGAAFVVNPAEDETYFVQAVQSSGSGCIKYDIAVCENPDPPPPCGFPGGAIDLLSADGFIFYPACQFFEFPVEANCDEVHWHTNFGFATATAGEMFTDNPFCGLGKVSDVIATTMTFTEAQGCRLVDELGISCILAE